MSNRLEKHSLKTRSLLDTAYCAVRCSSLRVMLYALAVCLPRPALGQAPRPISYTFSTLAGSGDAGSADGVRGTARFRFPIAVAVDIVGNVYVSDRGNNTVRKITSAGVVTTLVGLPGSAGNEDGMGTAARFNEPSGVAVDSAGSLYIADAGNCTIRKVTATGVVTTLAGVAGSAGSEDGTGRAARFNDPCGVAVDSRGILIVADSGNDVVRKVTSAGKVTTVAGLAGSAGNADGTGSGARFYGPSGVAIDKAGNAYVADRHNFTIRKVTPAGVVTTVAGLAVNAGSADGAGSEARFNDPMGVAVDAAGSIYVTDTGSSTIRRVAAGIVRTLAGMTRGVGSADGTGSAARFNSPAGIAVDSKGNLYVADVGSHTIRKGIPAGIQ